MRKRLIGFSVVAVDGVSVMASPRSNGPHPRRRHGRE